MLIGVWNMKIRRDFVTNSSSNNFVFAFKSLTDYQDFKDYCEEYEYQAIEELVENLLKSSGDVYDKGGLIVESADSKDILNDIKHRVYALMSNDYRYELLEAIQAENETKHKDFSEVLAERNRIIESPVFQRDLLEKVKENTDWEKVETSLDEAELVVYGTIWDTNGGMMEWAIRNGFLLQEFRKWCLCSVSIG